MYHVDNSTGVPVMPQPSPVTSETELFFTEGGNGVPPTYPGPDWFNAIQSELLNILRAAGLDPDKMDNTQILAALKKLFLSRSNPFGDIKADGPAAIATALSNLQLGEAAKRSVGTGANQIPDMSSFVLTGIGSDNLLAKLPNGLIIQVFRRNISNSKNIGVATVNPVTYPTPFPNTVWGAFCTKMTFAQVVTSCESVTLSGLSATTALVSGDNGSSANPGISAAVFLVIGA